METQRSFYDRKMKLLEKFRNKFYKILHDLKWHFPEGNCQKSYLAIFNAFNSVLVDLVTFRKKYLEK